MDRKTLFTLLKILQVVFNEILATGFFKTMPSIEGRKTTTKMFFLCAFFLKVYLICRSRIIDEWELEVSLCQCKRGNLDIGIG